MNSAERVMCVLRGQEPDRIPHFEWIIDEKVRDAICPGCSTEEFTVRMGLDAMLTAPDYTSTQVEPNRFRNEWGIVVERGAEQHATVVETAVATLEDFAGYTPPRSFGASPLRKPEEIGVSLQGRICHWRAFERRAVDSTEPDGIRGVDDGLWHDADACTPTG